MEKLFRVPAKEVVLFRLVCSDCKTAIEVGLDRLGTSSLTCPGCRMEFRRPNCDMALKNFASSLTALQQNELFEFQLVIPGE